MRFHGRHYRHSGARYSRRIHGESEETRGSSLPPGVGGMGRGKEDRCQPPGRQTRSLGGPTPPARRHGACFKITDFENHALHPYPEFGNVLKSNPLTGSKLMKELSASPKDTPRSLSPLTIRDCAAVGFRQSRIILYTFWIVFFAVIAITWVMPAEYESEVKILVKRERVDPVVTPENNAQPIIQRDLTEEDLNSEVEILKSADLIEKVAVETGLTELVSESRLKGFALGWIRNKE